MSRLQAVVRAARRVYWREADARVVVNAWRDSGDTLASFCRRYGVKRARVARWAKEMAVAEAVRFHPVAVVPPEGAREAFLELELPGGAIIRLPVGFDVEDLRRVLSALAERERC